MEFSRTTLLVGEQSNHDASVFSPPFVAGTPLGAVVHIAILTVMTAPSFPVLRSRSAAHHWTQAS